MEEWQVNGGRGATTSGQSPDGALGDRLAIEVQNDARAGAAEPLIALNDDLNVAGSVTTEILWRKQSVGRNRPSRRSRCRGGGAARKDDCGDSNEERGLHSLTSIRPAYRRWPPIGIEMK